MCVGRLEEDFLCSPAVIVENRCRCMVYQRASGERVSRLRKESWIVVSEGRPAHDGSGPAGENDTTQCLDCMPGWTIQLELCRFNKLDAVRVFPGHIDHPQTRPAHISIRNDVGAD